MRLIKHIKASNLLSFGPAGLDLELQDLNVLIGPNGSGKSNFLEIFEMLRSLPRNEEDSRNLEETINQGGGIEAWCWRGANKADEISLEVITSNEQSKHAFEDFRHTLVLGQNYFLKVSAESISLLPKRIDEKAFFVVKPEHSGNVSVFDFSINDYNIFIHQSKFSILSKRVNQQYINELAELYERMRLYREWSFGRNTIFRIPQRADQRNDRLEPDFSNLGIFLSRLRKDPPTKRALVGALRDLYEGLTDFEVIIEGGSVQIFFTEGDYSIPATRLSDGSLRYLCLLALLLDPTPPPLICIEEPELGLHPDLLPKIADLLVDTSKRTQLVVTTHSDVLIDALSEQPESVLVCEKHEGQTSIKRLEKSEIAHWLEDYRLGQLWTRGEIGGTRW